MDSVGQNLVAPLPSPWEPAWNLEANGPRRHTVHQTVDVHEVIEVEPRGHPCPHSTNSTRLSANSNTSGSRHVNQSTSQQLGAGGADSDQKRSSPSRTASTSRHHSRKKLAAAGGPWGPGRKLIDRVRLTSRSGLLSACAIPHFSQIF
jgi:hypothetical protein